MHVKHNPKKIVQANLSQKIADTLLVYCRTQFVLIAMVTLIVWGILTYLRVPYALVLAIVTGSASIVPVLGITVAAILTSIVVVFDGIRFLPSAPAIIEGVVIIIVYGCLNMFVDYILSPYLVGKSMKVHPLILLAAILLGTWVFGIVGALLTVPAILVIKTVLEYRSSSWQ